MAPMPPYARMDTSCKSMQDHRIFVQPVLSNVETVQVQHSAHHASLDIIWIQVVAKLAMETLSKMEELVYHVLTERILVVMSAEQIMLNWVLSVSSVILLS